MPLFKLGQFNGSVPKLLHWFQCVPQFPSSCSYSLLFPFLICTFSIQLFVTCTTLIEFWSPVYELRLSFISPPLSFPTNYRPFCFSSVMLRGKNTSEMTALMFAT